MGDSLGDEAQDEVVADSTHRYRDHGGRRRAAERDYEIKRSVETARRLRLLADMIYRKDSRGAPLCRVADLLDGTDTGDIPQETEFMLVLIVDHVLNDFPPNQRPVPLPPEQEDRVPRKSPRG